MDTSYSPLVYVNLLGAGFGAVLGATLIVRSKSAERPLRLLGCVWLCGAIAALLIIAKNGMGLRHLKELWLLEYAVTLFSGPLLYLYCQCAAQPARFLVRTDLAHFFPATILLFAAVAELAWRPPIELVLAHQMAYTAVSAGVWFLRECASAEGTTSSLWPGRILAWMAMIHVAQAARLGFPRMTELRDLIPLVLTAGFLCASAIVFMAYFRANSESTAVIAAAPVSPLRQALPKYQKSGLGLEEAQLLIEKLEREMRNSHAYRDASLSLADLASRLETSPHDLSRALNQFAGETFFEYLSRYRVEDLKQRLADPSMDHLTMEALAEEAGFPSRSSFYAAFRRRMGVTPSAFRRQNRQ